MIISHLFWVLREGLTKVVLLWQTRNMDFFYRCWLWFQRRSTGNRPADRALVDISAKPGQPFFSINIFLTPHDQPANLQGTLVSLERQQYMRWEAWVYIPAEWTQNGQASFIQNQAGQRVQIVPYKEEQKSRLYTISLERAAGAFVCWVIPGGTFEPDALTEIAVQAERCPDADLFYFDEDVLHPGITVRQSPFFKPGWSPAMLLSVNYLRGSFYRTAFLLQTLEKDLPLDSEWDLALHCSADIHHAVRIARVLFHSPAALNGLGTTEEDERALIRHLERLNLTEPKIRRTPSGHPQLAWNIRDHKVSIIIPTKDHPSDLQKCIESIQIQAANLEYEIIIIDTGSRDPAVEDYYRQVLQDPHVTLLRDAAPFNYSRINNLGAAHASGDLLLFLNNDVRALQTGWIEELARWMEYPGVGIVGPKLLFPDGTVQHAGIVLGMEGHASHVFGNAAGDFPNPFGSLDWYRNYQAVTGACMMTSRSVFQQAGGFDEDYRLVFSDVEYCLRVVQQGHRVVYTPFCLLIHYEGKSRARFIPPEDIRLAYQHFIHCVREGDPYYHPGLSYTVRQPVFAWGFEQRPAARLEKIYQYASLKIQANAGAGKNDRHS